MGLKAVCNTGMFLMQINADVRLMWKSDMT
jgi:hypothetical protein